MPWALDTVSGGSSEYARWRAAGTRIEPGYLHNFQAREALDQHTVDLTQLWVVGENSGIRTGAQ